MNYQMTKDKDQHVHSTLSLEYSNNIIKNKHRLFWFFLLLGMEDIVRKYILIVLLPNRIHMSLFSWVKLYYVLIWKRNVEFGVFLFQLFQWQINNVMESYSI